jgi:hypothetical protein
MRVKCGLGAAAGGKIGTDASTGFVGAAALSGGSSAISGADLAAS